MAIEDAEGLAQLTKGLKEQKAAFEDARKASKDYAETLRNSNSIFESVAKTMEQGNLTTWTKEYNKASSEQQRLMASHVQIAGQLGAAFFEAGKGAQSYGDQFNEAFKNVNGKTIPILGSLVTLIKGYDDVTTITRKFKGAAIDVGSAFGESFATIQPQFAGYANAVRLAQDYTYATRDAIEQQTKALATMGISMEEMTKTSYVGGTAQNMLSEGFLLASDTGLRNEKVFEMMAIATRKMGLSSEDAGRPLLSLQNIARSTGLPLDDLSTKVFGIAERYARFGTTVDSLAPIVKRFTDVLGAGFKGLAIQEVQSLIEGLGRQVNTTQGAFMAMQSGMARPGVGVAGALLDFESAMAKPEEAMKMLASSLSGISGGKILKFEEARAGGESAATQFKLQRDMLTQLTGINDPQQTKTLLAILSDVQSGRQVTQDQKETLDSALKSGQQKQDEKATAAERLMKVMVGLLTDADIKLAKLAETKLPSPQAQAAGFAKGGGAIEDATKYILDKAEQIGNMVLPESVKNIASKGNKYWDDALNSIEPGQELRGKPMAPDMGSFYRPTNLGLPEAARPAPTFSSTPLVASGGGIGESVKNLIVTLRGDDEMGKLMAKNATISIREANHGR